MHWLILTLVALWPITAQAQPQVNCAIALDVQGQWKQNIADIDRRYDELAFAQNKSIKLTGADPHYLKKYVRTEDDPHVANWIAEREENDRNWWIEMRRAWTGELPQTAAGLEELYLAGLRACSR